MRRVASLTSMSSLALWLNALIISIVFWDNYDHEAILLWNLAFMLLLFARLLIAKRFLATPQNIMLDIAQRSFKIITLLSVMLIAFGLQMIFPVNESFHQAFLSMIVAGLSAGAVMSLSYYKHFVVIYLMILILPFTYTIYHQNSQVHTMISILMMVFFVMLCTFARQYYENIVASIRSAIIIQEKEAKLKVQEYNYSLIFNEVPIGVFTYDKDLIVKETNQAFRSLLDVTKEEIIGTNLNYLPDQSILPTLGKILKGENGTYEGSYRSKYKQKEIWAHLKTVPLYDQSGHIKGGLGIIDDFSQRRSAENKIHQQAFYDHLTGLANRLTLNNALEKHLLHLRTMNVYSSLLFIDLDNFKEINDTLGHHIGDILLRIFASRTLMTVSSSDTVARLGGDEFIILLTDTYETKEQAEEWARKITLLLHGLTRESLKIEEYNITLSMSIGVTILCAETGDIHDALRFADIAMYRAKQMGKDTTCFFEEKMSDTLKEQILLKHDLRMAIKEQQFVVHYQPIIALQSGVVDSFEALVRWSHSQKGIIYPDSFIPYAESNGLIEQIEIFVLEQVCRDFKWFQGKINHIAVNISLKWFNKLNFVEQIMQIIDKFHVHPRNIKLELTESVILDNYSTTIEKMKRLKMLGFAIAMDDFGTGYSSLSYLKNLPFDTIKIDRAFIKNILINEGDASLVKIILAISKQFDFLVVAEGVETAEQVAFLREFGCDYIQGYYISKPLRIEELQNLLNGHYSKNLLLNT